MRLLLVAEQPWVKPEFTCVYEVMTDENGCFATDRVEVKVIKERIALVPTGFSPNKDNFNDRFLIHSKIEAQIELFKMFDRLGTLVFQSDELEFNEEENSWDGTFRGKELPIGVYIWTMER